MVRPTQQTSTKRKRKSNDLIWARDGDHKNAQEHPCYLLENNCNEGAPSNNSDKVWVEWSSNGTVACIPKSRISTKGLSSRRRRTNNNNTEQASVAEKPTINNTKQKRTPSTKRSEVDPSTSTSNSNTNAIPELIYLERCGIPEVNGTYYLQVADAREDGLSVDNGKDGVAPVYRKKGILKGEKDIEIYRTASTLGYGHWYIGTPSISFYKISYKMPPPLPNRPQRIGNIPFLPPIEDWERAEHGLYPLPKTYKLIHESRRPDQILVEGCGIPEFNGIYNYYLTYMDAPYYMKRDVEYFRGGAVNFRIYRDLGQHHRQTWYIGIDRTERFYKLVSHHVLPPLYGWKVMGKGIDPAPTLKYVCKTRDDSITSSVSDSAEVKKEDTKVKEEMYGGETDEEEDKKIAAVPSLVSSSSQLTTSAYDEDTDDDVAPDPVQSTQLKVKEEEEDTDNEGISPDPVESAQIKIKTEEAGEDTDDEAPAPDQIQSSQMKSEEDLYGQDTDEEDGKVADAPSPIASAKVKSEQVNSYDMETDDEDSKLDAPSPVVSSQVKKKEVNSYDMDTDDDIAPDTVQRSEKRAPSTKRSEDESNDSTTATLNADKDSKSDDERIPDQILVEGCGISEVNGTYQLDYDDEDSGYYKSGDWKGEVQDFVIYRQEHYWESNDNHTWYIGLGIGIRFYESTRNGKFPPLYGWELSDNGLDPAPTLTYKYKSVDDNITSSISDSIQEDTKEKQEKGYETDDNNSESEAESFASCESKSITTWDSSNEKYNESAKVYLWCEGQYGYKEYALVLLPYNYYLFWKKLKRCKTFGDIRKLCGKGHYYNFEEKYAMNHDMKHDYDSDYDDYDTCLKNLTDSTKVCMDDFDLSEHSEYGDCTAVGHFPPLLEQVMWEAAKEDKERHGWMLEYGEVEEPWGMGERWLKFKPVDKDKIFKKIEELGCTVKHFPKLGEEFTSMFQM